MKIPTQLQDGAKNCGFIVKSIQKDDDGYSVRLHDIKRQLALWIDIWKPSGGDEYT